MKIGFSGTRRGMSAAQLKKFTEIIRWLQPTEFHFGDCVGADTQAADAVDGYRYDEGQPKCRIVAHPPLCRDFQANNPHSDQAMPRLPYLVRNRAIVQAADLLVATPLESEEQYHGGTWRTAHYAKQCGKWLMIIWPDGSVRESNRPEVDAA